MDTANPDPHQQLEALQAELAVRPSIDHFARAGVAMVASLIIGGTAAKLGWDTYRMPLIGQSVGILALLIWVYAFVHYRRGKRHLRAELERFEALKALRRSLKLDDPSTLLPQR